LKNFAKKILSVEIDKTATEYANINAKLNKVENFKNINLPSEKTPQEILEKTDLLILDPPRPGLHKKLISLILEKTPRNIFYLSCNPISQAKDFSLLRQKYKVKKLYGLDFYPNTPHLESLLILELI
jgi:tRNA/tmRNA/rRNA uracil-C5-methylase (TrmA/RlmC/RlmD family)